MRVLDIDWSRFAEGGIVDFVLEIGRVRIIERRHGNLLPQNIEVTRRRRHRLESGVWGSSSHFNLW